MATTSLIQSMIAAGVATFFAFCAAAQTAKTTESPAPPASGPLDPTALGVRADCVHDFNRDKGSAQECITITGLRYTVHQTLSPKLRGVLRLDPFATLIASRENSPIRSDLPLVRDTEFVMVDQYALIWSPRPNLEVAIESYDGAAKIPSVSRLALADSLSDTGWKQTALTVTYNLPALRDMRVKFVAGNGEGENGRNLDPQQYFGFEAEASPVAGLRANLGVSLDGNSIGSAEDAYLTQNLTDDCGYKTSTDRSKLGYSTQRLAAGVALDGTMAGAEGLEVGLGWQRNDASDLDKERAAYPNLTDRENCRRFDPDSFFVEEDPGAGVNTVERTTLGLSVLYRMFDTYFVSADYTTRKLDTGSVKAFAGCSAYRGSECILPSGDTFNTLSQTVLTFGGGMALDTDLRLTIEYGKADFDREYAKVFYDGQDGKASKTHEMFNARIAYNWK